MALEITTTGKASEAAPLVAGAPKATFDDPETWWEGHNVAPNARRRTCPLCGASLLKPCRSGSTPAACTFNGGKTMSDKVVDVSCLVKRQTEKAWLVVSEHGKEVWLPKSQVEVDIDGAPGGRLPWNGVVTLPQWLAINEELV